MNIRHWQHPLIILLLLINVFSGCIFSPFQLSFSLLSYEIVDDDGFPGILLNFSSTDSLVIDVIKPDKTIISSETVFYGSNTVLLDLAGYRETISSGSYKLKVYDKEHKNEIFKKTISFDIPDFLLLSSEQNWWNNKDTWVLASVTLTVFNDGSMPLYPHSAVITIGSQTYHGLILPTTVLPHQQKNVTCLFYQPIDDVNAAEFSISILDMEKKTLGKGIFQNNVKSNVPSETFSWEYKWKMRTIRIPYSSILHAYYTGLERSYYEDYSLYVFDPYDETYLDVIAAQFLPLADEKNNDVDLVNLIASFVQNLPYKQDNDENVTVEYPFYPVETLFTDGGGGDCEDKSILAASLLKKIGYNVSLLRLTNHMAVGVNLNQTVPPYEYYIGNYYFLETTTRNHKLGYVPSDYKEDENVTVYSLSLRPLPFHQWKNGTITIYRDTFNGDFVKVTIIVENMGLAAGENISVQAGFYSQNSFPVNVLTDYIPYLEPGVQEKITFLINIPQPISTTFKTQVFLNGRLVNQREAASEFP